MRRDPEFFDDQALELLYIGKRVDQSQMVEVLLDTAGIDYAIEVDSYVGGTIFRTTRAGAFFYVPPVDYSRAAALLVAEGLNPQPPEQA